jgi:NADH-quinone oxidoreductase subunit M
VIGAALGVNVWLAALSVLGLLISTGVYLWMLSRVAMGEKAAGSAGWHDLNAVERWAILPLAAGSLLIGLLPGSLITALDSAFRAL